MQLFFCNLRTAHRGSSQTLAETLLSPPAMAEYLMNANAGMLAAGLRG